MSNAFTAIKSARAYLNDINGITWSDAILFPLLQEAHGELQQELERNNTGVLKIQTAPMVVPAGATTLGTNQPSTIINPISMVEGDIGDSPDSFQDMIRVNFIPYEDRDDWLSYWAWIGQVITFLGCTRDKQVVLRYEGMLTTPQTLNDPLGCIFAERFIGPRIAALAYGIAGKNYKWLMDIAERNLYTIVANQVVNNQTPVRRKAYRSPKFGDIGVTKPITISGGPSTNQISQWIPTVTPPDGIRTTFYFSAVPMFISWNGLNQYKNQGYTVYASPGNSIIHFRDVLGNILTPGAADTIIAVKNNVQFNPLIGPDGVRTDIVMPVVPDYMLWNNLNQFLGVGYNQEVVTQSIVSFIDNLGNVLVPGVLDDIREAV